MAALAQTLDGGKSWISKMLATATPPQEFNLPLADGVVSASGIKTVYYKTQEEMVTVLFDVEISASGNPFVIATLPAGYRSNYGIALVAIGRNASGIWSAAPVTVGSGLTVHAPVGPGHIGRIAGAVTFRATA